MTDLAFDNAFQVFAALTFVSVLLLLEALFLLWRSRYGQQARKLRDRMESATSGRSIRQTQSLMKERLFSEIPKFERALRAVPQLQTLERYIQQSGLRWTVTRLIVGSVLLGFLGSAVSYEALRQSGLTSLGVGLGMAALPMLYLRWRRTRRLARIEAQLPDTLDLITRALRAGHAFTSSLKMVADEMPEPVAGEFRAVHEEVSFGISLHQALTNLSERVPLTDVRYFAVAVLVQRESGGNLAEVFNNLSRLVRDRSKLASRVRVLSSDGKMSAWLLGLMPVVLAGVLYLFNPKFMGPLFTDPIGVSIIEYLLIMMFIGAIVMRKIIRIRY